MSYKYQTGIYGLDINSCKAVDNKRVVNKQI